MEKIRAYLALLCSALLRLADIVFFTIEGFDIKMVNSASQSSSVKTGLHEIDPP